MSGSKYPKKPGKVLTFLSLEEVLKRRSMLDMLHSRLSTVFKNYPAPESNSDIYDKQVALRPTTLDVTSVQIRGKNAESYALSYKTMALQRG